MALAPVSARAQAEAGSLVGVVQDVATSRPLIGAAIYMSGPGTLTSRTDETGAFRIAKVEKGTYTVLVRALGYLPFRQSVTISADERLVVGLTRVAMLDTLRVRAANQAIYGVVATSHDMRPIPLATVQVFGTSIGEAVADSAGRFFYSIKSPGPYLVRAKSPGLGTRAISVTVVGDEGVEVALLLDSTPAFGANALEMAYGDFRDRLQRRSNGSIVLTNSQILARGEDLTSALLSALTAKSLRLSNEICIFVDGRARVGASPSHFDERDIEMLEVYSATAERSGTLADAWPRGARCGDTGMARTTAPQGTLPNDRARSSDIARWLVIWLKH